MAITAEEIKNIFEKLLQSREENIINHITTECEKINDNITALSHRITALEDDVQKTQDNILALENEVTINKNNMNIQTTEMGNDVRLLNVLVKELENQVEDQTNRNMRNTLIIKGIREDPTEKNWDDATNALVSHLTSIFDWDPDSLNADIERCHRGRKEAVEMRNDNKRNQPRPIFVKFHSWKTAEQIRRRIIGAHKQKKTRIIVSQMFSKKTTKRMNDQLEIRKHLLLENKEWRAVVKFPGILLVKKPGDADFSPYKAELPVQDDGESTL